MHPAQMLAFRLIPSICAGFACATSSPRFTIPPYVSRSIATASGTHLLRNRGRGGQHHQNRRAVAGADPSRGREAYHKELWHEIGGRALGAADGSQDRRWRLPGCKRHEPGDRDLRIPPPARIRRARSAGHQQRALPACLPRPLDGRAARRGAGGRAPDRVCQGPPRGRGGPLHGEHGHQQAGHGAAAHGCGAQAAHPGRGGAGPRPAARKGRAPTR